MSVLLSPALMAFVQIVLALIAGYVCFVLVKLVRDATSRMDTVSIRRARRDIIQPAVREATLPDERRASAPTRQ